MNIIPTPWGLSIPNIFNLYIDPGSLICCRDEPGKRFAAASFNLSIF